MKIRVRHPAIGEAVFLLGEDSVVTLGRRGRTAVCEFGWDPRISDRHARMWIEEGRVWFEDLKSRHGSHLGDRRIEGRIGLEPGDSVRIGDTWLLIPDELDEWTQDDRPLWTPSDAEDAPASEWVQDQPRRHQRYVTRHPVVVRIDGDPELRAAVVRDVSLGGVFLEARRPPSEGTRVEITIDRNGGALRLDGEVVHVVDSNRSRAYTIPTGVGIRLNGISGQVQVEWSRFLRSLGAPVARRRPPPVRFVEPAPPALALPERTPWWRAIADAFTPAWERVL